MVCTVLATRRFVLGTVMHGQPNCFEHGLSISLLLSPKQRIVRTRPHTDRDTDRTHPPFQTRLDLRFVSNPIMNIAERDGEINILLVEIALVEVPFPLVDVNSVVLAVTSRGHARVSLEDTTPPLFCYHRDCNCLDCRGAAL